MNNEDQEYPDLEVSLPQEFADQLEKETGFRLDELDGVTVRLVGGRLMFRSSMNVQRDVQIGNLRVINEGAAGTECNGKDNKWQDQSSCGNLITTC